LSLNGLNGLLPGREGEKWTCTNVLKGWHERSVFSCDWTKDEEEFEGGLGRILTAGGDGKICIFQVVSNIPFTHVLLFQFSPSLLRQSLLQTSLFSPKFSFSSI